MEENYKNFFEGLDKERIDRFKGNYIKFTTRIEEYKKEFPPESIEKLNEFYFTILNLLKEQISIRIRLVIDTVILFREIYAIMHERDSYLKRIIEIPFLELYAPKEIKDELMQTIDQDLPIGKDKEEAISIARIFLEKINILSSYDEISWKIAFKSMGKHDPKDVSFLAIAISIGADGIITEDKHFFKQDDMSVWKLGESGRTAFTVSRSVLSLYLLDISINKILLTIGKWIFLIFQGFLEIFHEIYHNLYDFFKIVKEKYSNLPKYAQIGIPVALIIIPAIILIFSEDARKKVSDFIISLKEKLQDFIKQISTTLRELTGKFLEIIEVLKPFFKFVLDGMGYMIYSSYMLYHDINNLRQFSNQKP